MLCYTTTTSTSNTTKNLYISKDYHSSYSTDNFNNQKEAMDRLFSTFVTPQIKEKYHPSIIQEWKLNIDATEYEKNMTLSNVPSYLKKFNRIDDFEHCPESIKSTLQWFPFHEIMEYTGNVNNDDVRWVSSCMTFPVYSII